ncbi:MAG TPA: acetyl-CoA hydrolase/transferase C-terminal domain-containing protein [Mycobacterium sp.]|jgi:hypothetical protein|nr:acetyl-CoA hydrolase/transferase C-terminal domain-containing protein [Mycobacterium sp.]
MTIALGDGVGTLRCVDGDSSVAATLSAVAREIGSLRLVLGWLPSPLEGLDAEAFTEVAALMPGWGMRGILTCPTARFIPVRLSAIPAVLRDALRPDVLLTRITRRRNDFLFTTEVSWQRELADAGITMLAVMDDTICADAGPALNPHSMHVVGRSADQPLRSTATAPAPVHESLADAVLRFVSEGARLQFGPGQLGTALLMRATRPLQIDTGMLTDGVVDLDRRGLLIGTPSATYLFGGAELYDWADGRPILHGIEYTHDFTRLSRGTPLFAVNTAIEIDPVGQVNVEGVGEKVIGGVGGHPDYCAAARMSRGGMSIIAVPSTTNGRSPLVDRLSRPASTPAHDIDLIVTESGHADLRGADWAQRQRLITALFT